MPKIVHAPAAPTARERFHYAPLDSPAAPQCLAPKSDTHDPATCAERGKHPVGSHVRNATNDPAAVDAWRRRGYNLGVVCGPSGVVILDEDTLGDLDRYCADHGHEPPVTYRVRSSKGWHYYFAEPDGARLGNRTPFKRDGYNIDVRGGNAYAVAAGSVHASGVVYEAEDDDAPVSAMPEWLAAYLRTPARREVEGGPRKAAEPYSGDGAWERGTYYERAAVNGCIASLRALPRPWPGDGAGWDQGTFDQACSLVELANVPFFELTIADAEALIQEHAPTDDAWGPEQVEAKIASARRTVGSRMRRDLSVDVVAEAAARTAPDLEALEREVSGYVERECTRRPNRPAVKAAIRLAFAARPKPPAANSAREVPKRALTLVNLADVEFVATEWAVEGLVPLGTITGIAGWAGIGKSTLVSWLVAGITRGTMDGDLRGDRSSVLIVAGEDDTGRQLAPRLTVAGADLARVAVVQPRVDTPYGQADTVMQLADDLPGIRQMLIDTGARMLVLDPILSFVDGNPNNQADVRRALDPLAAIARELNIAVVVVMHFKKGHGVAGEKVSGSHVWRDTLRSLLVMAIDEESEYRVVTVDKSNYSDSRGRSLLFEVTGEAVRGRDTKGNHRSQVVSKATHIGESPKSVQDLLEAESAKRDGRRAVNDDTAEVIAWICEQNEPVRWVDICAHVGVDPNAKDGPEKRAGTNLHRKLGRAVDRGDLSRVERGLYHRPTGLRPLDGLGEEEF